MNIKQNIKRIFEVIYLIFSRKAKLIWKNALAFNDGHFEKAIYFLPMTIDLNRFIKK